MFNLYKLSSTHNWDLAYISENIQEIYNKIEIYNSMGYKGHYRIDNEDIVFAFVDSSEYQLNYIREHYNTNEKCKSRYTYDEKNYTKRRK